MNFHTGQIVRFKTVEELEKIAEYKDEDGFSYLEPPSGVCVNRAMMKEYCGKKVLILELFEHEYYYGIRGKYEKYVNHWCDFCWNITDEMLICDNINKRLE